MSFYVKQRECSMIYELKHIYYYYYYKEAQ